MSAARATLIYDGNCGFCRRWVERVRRWDRRGRLEMVPYQTVDLETRFPGVSRADCVERIHLVDERAAGARDSTRAGRLDGPAVRNGCSGALERGVTHGVRPTLRPVRRSVDARRATAPPRGLYP